MATSDSDPTSRLERRSGRLLWLLAIELLVMVGVLNAMGRTWWCKFNDASIWISSAASEHTSQHLFDPYTFTHIAHGFIFWALLSLLPFGFASRLLIAAGLECVWEIFENTPFVIDRYRTTTAALGYIGDSIANSIADVAACCSGFLFANRFGGIPTLLLFCLFEIGLLLTIRDSLALNVLMLCCPIESIRQWQLNP